MKNTSTSLTKLTLQKFKRNGWGVFSLIFLCLGILVALFAYVLAPDNSKNANQMHVEIHSKKPGFTVEMLTIPLKEERSQSFFNKLFMGSTQINTEIPIQSYSILKEELEYIGYGDGLPKTISLAVLNNTPKKYITKKTFYFGTDKYGRDLLSRLLIGTRISFFIGFIAVFISLFIGIGLSLIHI